MWKRITAHYLMDQLTHTAVGLFLGRAGLNRWTPHATPILIMAANAPDIDIVAAAAQVDAAERIARQLLRPDVGARQARTPADVGEAVDFLGWRPGWHRIVTLVAVFKSAVGRSHLAP